MHRVVRLAGLFVFASMAPVFAASGPFVVFFSPWSAAFDGPANGVIAKAAASAKADPHASITVTSAADTIGSTQANIYLSETRAQVVADALVQDGVERSRIRQVALGAKGMPDTQEQFERRVVIKLAP